MEGDQYGAGGGGKLKALMPLGSLPNGGTMGGYALPYELAYCG